MNSLGQKLNWAWRLLGTAISFTLFGLGSCLLGLLVVPLLLVFQRDAGKRQFISRYCIGKVFSLLMGLMKFLGVLSYQVRHAERLQGHSGTLVIANHPSLIDVVFLISFFPQAECVIKTSVTRNFFMRSTALAANYISNEDTVRMLSACIDKLQRGANLVLFPEATRSIPGQPLKFRLGAATVAVRSKATLLPIIIRCSPTTLSKGEPWYHIPHTRPHWDIDVLQPIIQAEHFTELADIRRETRALNARLSALFEQALNNTCGG